jgi:hypothetical protein
MKKPKIKSIILFAAFIISVSQVFAFAIPSTELFKNQRAIVPSSSSGYAKLELDENIYNNLLIPPYDIRLFDKNNTEVPYFLNTQYPISKENNTSVIITNKGYINDYIHLELSLFNISKPISSLKFDINTNNTYIIQPEIKGSDDKTTWVDIKTSSFLYKISSKSSQFSDTIYIDPITFQYLKVDFKVLSGNVIPDNIRSVFYSQSSQQISQLSKNKNSGIVNTQIEGEKSIVLIDNKYANAPIDRVNFIIENKDFSRQVALFGSNDQKKWDIIASAEEIYSIKVQKTNVSKTYLDTSNVNYRYIKAHFLNNDSAPLTISSVEVLYYPDYIIFDCIANTTYTAYFGNSKIKDARYNTAKLQNFIDITSLNEVFWEPQTIANPNYNGTDLSDSENNKYILTIFIALMVLVLGWFILKSLQSVKLNSDNNLNNP